MNLTRSVKSASLVSWRIVRGSTSNGRSSNQIKKHWFCFLSSQGPHFGSNTGEEIIVREGGYLSRSVKSASLMSWRIVRGFTSNGGSSNQIKKHWLSFLSSHGPHFGSNTGEEIIVRKGGTYREV